MSEATPANVVPMIPEADETPKSTPVKHYRDRNTNLPLCGAPREEGNIARTWKDTNCPACEAAKGKPGRPAKDKPEPTKPEPKSVQVQPESDGALAVQISILANAFLVTPACIKMKKGPPPAEMVMQLGPAVVDVLDHYGYRDQVDHPGVKLAVVASALALAVYSSPTIQDEKELLKSHGIEKADSPK